MKATGVVRRMDELGRIVVPKEVRKTMRIKEGDSLEIYIDGNERIVLKKYSPVQNINDFIVEYVESVLQATKKDILITDNEIIIACAGNYKKEMVGRHISMRLEERISKRATFIVDKNESIEVAEGIEMKKPSIIKPITVFGDVSGCIVITGEREITDVEKALAELTGTFISRYLEG